MYIAILGTGRMARGIAFALRETTHEIAFGSRDPVGADALARAMQEEVGRRYHGTTLPLATMRADLTFLAVPWAVAVETAAPLREALDGRILVDLTNPLAPGLGDLATPPDTSASEILQAALGQRVRVVGALKNTFAATFAEPGVAGGPAPDVLVCGDDPGAKAAVMELVAAMGFGALDAGGLRSARAIERMTLLLIDLDRRYHLGGMTGFRLLRSG